MSFFRSINWPYFLTFFVALPLMWMGIIEFGIYVYRHAS